VTPDLGTLRDRFPRVAISHEWLTIPGGSEKVVLQLLELFPDADIYTSVYDPGPWPEAIRLRRVHTSFLDRLPGATRYYPRLLPLMNTAFESFDLDGYDLVISSNHACAKNVITAPGTLHVCYCHTPMRYAWDPGFFAGEQLGRVERALLPFLLARLRRQDVVAAARPDLYVANSQHVAARIRKFYRRDARVIHPAVDVAPLLTTARRDQGYYVFLGRLVPYKRADLAVAACARLDRPLKVVGGGRGEGGLGGLAGPRTEFVGRVDDAALAGLLAGARALLFPGEEDFGMVPVEAQAAGVPVIAYGRGGARDTVIDGKTGVLYDDPGVDGLCNAIRRFEGMRFDTHALRDHARGFAPEHFRRQLAELLLGSADNTLPMRRRQETARDGLPVAKAA
jgi:glycosyltransferase involved in cell wall biosynthesis